MLTFFLILFGIQGRIFLNLHIMFFGFSQILGGWGQDQSCENSQPFFFFSNDNLPKIIFLKSEMGYRSIKCNSFYEDSLKHVY